MAAKKATPKKNEQPQTKALAPRQTTALSADLTSMMAQDAAAGGGLQNMRPEDMALPFLQIIQSMSPQRKKNHEKFIPGAEEGDVFNSVDGTLYKDGVRVIPCHFVKSFIEWIPRDQGGGFVASHDRFSPIVEATPVDRTNGQRITEDGNQLVETAMYYVLVVNDDGSTNPAIISMSSTQLKKSRKWNTLLQARKVKNAAGHMMTPPMFSAIYTLTTTEESSDKGSWMGWVIDGNCEPIADVDLYTEARALSLSVANNAVQGNFNSIQPEDTEQGEHF